MDESLALFYRSLLQQNPKSRMAITWCLKNKMENHVKKYADTKTYSDVKKGMKGMKGCNNKKTDKVKDISNKMDHMSIESNTKKKIKKKKKN